jgi:hypothetical protein
MDTRIYSRPSALTGDHLALATSAPDETDGRVYFRGFMRSPRVVAGGMLVLADIAAADFRQARAERAGGRDPVVTSDGERLRLESLSRCGGVYGRLDVEAAGLEGVPTGRGTTNIDVNAPLYQALSRIGGDDPLRLTVGAEEVSVTTVDGQVVEKRVPLPARWLRGLAEVAARAAALDPRMELPAGRAGGLLAEVSSTAARRTRWIVPAGRTWRSSGRAVPGAICVADGFRLSVLRPLLPLARTVTVYSPPATAAPGQVSGWTLEFGTARFTMLLSDAAMHGFAGDGQLLGDLASDTAVADGDALATVLATDPVLDQVTLAERTGWAAGRVASALSALATAGQVGYDLAAAAHYHRPLPYRADLVAALHPRLAAARLLATAGTVTHTANGFEVTSGERVYLVHAKGDGYACTCAWWARHQGGRGPCKHVVAATIVGHAAGDL